MRHPYNHQYPPRSYINGPHMINKPDYHQQEEFQNRTSKLNEIRQAGLNPYPHSYKPTHTALGLQETFKGSVAGHSDDAAAGTTLP